MQNESIQRERYPTAGPRHLLCRPSSGFSLLEVLVASGILVFGILAIARIFPAGLGVIRSNQDVNTATRLAEDLQTRYSRLKDELPEAVISVDASGEFVTDIDPTTSPDDSTPNSVSGVTRVVGETHRVLSNGNLLVNFPQIAALDLTATDPELQNPRVYRERSLTEVEVTVAPGANQFRQTAAGTLGFNASEGGHYVRISYKWVDTDSAANGRTYYVERERQLVPSGGSVTITVAAADAGIAKPGISPASFDRVLPKSWKVLEEEPVAVDAAMSDDQRQCGVIPLSSGYTTNEKVKVDYTINDWRWVSETATVPQSRAVPLLFNDILETKGVSVAELQTYTTIGGASYTTDYQKGEVTFTSSSNLQGTPVRLTYQTGAEWTVQIAKGPATFTDAVTATKPETYRQFADRFWQTADSSVTDYQKILGFKQINAGGTVVVDYVTTTGTSVYGEMHAIGRDAATTPVYTTHPYEINLFSPYREIISVRGVSSTARVFWIDKGHYRRVEISTYLVKK